MNHSKRFFQEARARTQLASCVFVLMLTAGSAYADAVALQVSGQVEIGRGEPPQWSALSQGDSIGVDDRVRTGADGRAELKLDAGTLRMHENSMLRLPPARNEVDQVELEKGHSLFDVLRRAGRRFEVHTPTVVVSVKGTRFGVDASAEMGQVAVYRGLVGVRGVGMEVALETLVREGFLATGGSGAPIELDLAPQGDPWASWQDFERLPLERPAAPAPQADLDRAKATLHRATNADVLRKAAERRPEVAERLRKMQADQADSSGKPSDEPGVRGAPQKAARPDRGAGRSFPASPDPSMDEAERGAGKSKQKMMQQMMRGADEATGPRGHAMRQKNRDQMIDVIKAEENLRETVLPPGGNPGGSGAGNPWEGIDLDGLGNVPPPFLATVVESFEEVQAQWEQSTTEWNSAELMTQLESAMLANGLPPDLARNIAEDLLGN